MGFSLMGNIATKFITTIYMGGNYDNGRVVTPERNLVYSKNLADVKSSWYPSHSSRLCDRLDFIR